MKLRIQDNSLRLRLTQKEVGRLGDQGSVEAAIRFSRDHVLNYSVSVMGSTDKIFARYEGDSVCVFLPEIMARDWARNNEVTIEAIDAGVRILVEKDFQCLHHAGEGDPDAYPHPLA